jgi:hypothetical protein
MFSLSEEPTSKTSLQCARLSFSQWFIRFASAANTLRSLLLARCAISFLLRPCSRGLIFLLINNLKTNKHMNTETYILPAYWASYLINGDASGLSDDEQAECDAWTDTNLGGNCVDVGEPYFAHRNDAGTLAGDVAEFTFFVD